MTIPDPYEIAEQTIRDHVRRIDGGCIRAHIGAIHPELTREQHLALRDEVMELIAAADYTLIFAKEGE